MPWDKIIMENNGGKSTYQAACEAYGCHKSQHIFKEYSVSFTEYDCRRFGLYRTKVGEDVSKDVFFENVTLRYIHVKPYEDTITENMEQVNAKGWLYRRTDRIGTPEEYVRYCMVGGISGWYAADYTGSLTKPVTCVVITKDEIISDLSIYENLISISEQPQLFEYRDRELGTMILRYCAVGNGEAAFYQAQPDGSLIQPVRRVDVSEKKSIIQQWQQNNAGENVRATDVVLVVICGLLVCTTVALCISVMNLSSKRRMRQRMYRRRYRR